MKVTIEFGDNETALGLDVLSRVEAMSIRDPANNRVIVKAIERANDELDKLAAAEAAPANPTSPSSPEVSSPSTISNETPSRRRRSDTSQATATETETASPSPEASSTSSRRRRGGSVSETSSPSEGSESAANPPGTVTGAGTRRRRNTDAGSAELTTGSGESAANPTPAPAVGRRRRTGTPATPASPAKLETATPDDKITDADLSMAVSQAATKITPKVVMGIMAEYGVTKVNELKPEQRREFLDHLKAAMQPGN